jgi:hypothetical protein
MIIGHGDIASVLNDREGAIFFASGVSNSQEKRREEFERERDLLQWAYSLDPEVSLFYFSSLSINFIDTPYTRHKNQMEVMIKTMFFNYNIIRIGNINWGTNPNTFINFIKLKRERGEPVEIKDEWKYMISKEQLLLLTDNLPLTGKNEISVFGECKKVIDLI